MRHRITGIRGLALGVSLSCAALAGAAPAGEPAAARRRERQLSQEDRIRELERQLVVVIEELARVRTGRAVPEEPDLESAHGLGPAASKVYGSEHGVSLGGYGEAFYRNFVGDSSDEIDRADALRFVTYLGYKFTDSIVFNMELELEHASTSKAGEISVEFATLDFLFEDWLNARAGLLLLPMGFVNEMHEPPFFFGVNRPEVEQRIIPTTWRENGTGIFGRSAGEELSYRAYVVNGFDATGYDASGLRGGRQKGSQALADDLAFVGRLDWNPLPELLLGGSVYVGNSGQDQEIDTAGFGVVGIPDARTTVLEAHGQLRAGRLWARGLYAMAFVDDAGKLSDALRMTGDLEPGEGVAEEMLGGYVELAYDVYPWLQPDAQKVLEPFVRVGYVDTQHDMPSGISRDRSKEEVIYTLGASFRPHPNVVLKADYRNRDRRRGDTVEEINLGLGFAF